MLQLVADSMDRSSLHISDELLHALQRFVEKNRHDIYLVGGAVRNSLIGRDSCELDLTVSGSALDCAEMLLAELGRGSLVDLSSHQGEAVRVVFNGQQVDISSFRGAAKTIEQDLILRDFSINAMAVSLKEILWGGKQSVLIDPTGGRDDLFHRRVIHLSGAFAADPLRMVRAFRLRAEFGFFLDSATKHEVNLHAPLVERAAVERVQSELNKIFESPRTWSTLNEMDEAGILQYIFPELYRGKDVNQPDFHHLDVFDHCFQCLKEMESIISRPEIHFHDHLELIGEYLDKKDMRSSLKYAALFHDLGKPSSKGHARQDNDRVTFYGHDEEGKALSQKIACRLRWSRELTNRVAGLVGMHMHPFHLCNVLRVASLSSKAVLKLCRRADDDLIGLFLLAMADSLASNGKLKPQFMEAELLQLFDRVVLMRKELVQPILDGPRLVTGSDLIGEFQLRPGPIIGEILERLDIARVEGKVEDRQGALNWVKEYIQKGK